VSQVIVVIIPIVGSRIMILVLNVVRATSNDVRVIKYVVNVVPQVRGRVLEVPADGNRPMKKATCSSRSIPRPTSSGERARGAARQRAGRQQGARGAADRARRRRRRRRRRRSRRRARACAGRAPGRAREEARDAEPRARRKGAGNRFDLEQAETNLREMEGTLDGARSAEAQARSAEGQALAAERQIRQRMGAKSNGEWAQVAQVARAAGEREVGAVADGALAPPTGRHQRAAAPGSMRPPSRSPPALTFVEDEFSVVAFFHQNELHQVKPGDEAEIFLRTLPGEIIKAKVDSIVWAQGQGTRPHDTRAADRARRADRRPLPVKLTVDPKYRDVFLAAGAQGDAAIYTRAPARSTSCARCSCA
jgi:multidrug resistance efflux pump